jgi:hypothetical protein
MAETLKFLIQTTVPKWDKMKRVFFFPAFAKPIKQNEMMEKTFLMPLREVKIKKNCSFNLFRKFSWRGILFF